MVLFAERRLAPLQLHLVTRGVSSSPKLVPVLLLARVNSDCDALSNFPSDLKARREKITRYNPTRHPRAILSPTSVARSEIDAAAAAWESSKQRSC